VSLRRGETELLVRYGKEISRILAELATLRQRVRSLEQRVSRIEEEESK
jgi:predicted  nucleic acid-binding Zn-ribbon protein